MFNNLMGRSVYEVNAAFWQLNKYITKRCQITSGHLTIAKMTAAHVAVGHGNETIRANQIS